LVVVKLHKFDDNGEDIEVVLRNDPTFFDEETVLEIMIQVRY